MDDVTETEEQEQCPVCLRTDAHDHDFDKEAAQLDEIFSRTGTESNIN
jgi:hypothetical protein